MKLHTTKSRRLAIAAIFLLACVYVSGFVAYSQLSYMFRQILAIDKISSGVAASIARMVEVIKLVNSEYQLLANSFLSSLRS